MILLLYMSIYTTCLETRLIPLVNFVVYITVEHIITILYGARSVSCLFAMVFFFCILIGTMIQLVFFEETCVLLSSFGKTEVFYLFSYFYMIGHLHYMYLNSSIAHDKYITQQTRSNIHT